MWRNCLSSAWATEGKARCYLQPAKRGRSFLINTQQDTKQEPKHLTQKTPTGCKEKSSQTRMFNPLWKFSKPKRPWQTCSNCEACSAYSREQGQVTPSGPHQPKNQHATQSSVMQHMQDLQPAVPLKPDLPRRNPTIRTCFIYYPHSKSCKDMILNLL